MATTFEFLYSKGLPIAIAIVPYKLHVCLCILYILSLQLHSQATHTDEYLYTQCCG